jgi:hypothetical protein
MLRIDTHDNKFIPKKDDGGCNIIDTGVFHLCDVAWLAIIPQEI